MRNEWIYDIEIYPNVFTFCTVFSNGKGLRVFEVSGRKDQTQELLEFLRNVVINKHKLVGFNNVGFDYQIIQKIIDEASVAKKAGNDYSLDYKYVYEFGMNIIKNQFSEGGFNLPYRENQFTIPQIDLYKIHHFDNKARATSLKILEFNMRSENIEDLPFPVGKKLSDDEIDLLIKYNKHDVMETLKFYRHSIEAIEFRENLTKSYGFDCTNYNDTKIGKEYFINQLEKRMPGSCYKMVGKRRQMRQTKRDKIDIADCLFDYVSYDRPEFQAVRNWFEQQVITETKGVFTDIPEHSLGELAKYADMITKSKKINDPDNPKNKHYVPTEEHLRPMKNEHPCGWVEEKELKSPKGAKSYYWNYRIATTLNVVVDGFRYDFGTGGIHGSIESETVRSDEEYIIIDADVSSMYPNIAIANRVYPEHLGEQFCDIYQEVYEARKTFPKGSAENAVMKLALNGVYGDSNNQYSVFYDPKYTMTITINGQLSLCMLAERLITIPNCKMIQCNTDGVTVKIPRKHRDMYNELCREWEQVTGLQLEFADYDAMFIRDVNNYIALYTDGKIKRKGAYEYENLGWHQNHSALVVAKAAEYELLGKGSVEEFVWNHKDKWDFMLRTKVPRNSRLVLEYENGVVETQQNICRYYPSTEGGKLVKIMPPLKNGGEERRLSIDKEWNVKTCNNINDFEWDVNYEYYIQEARKLVDPLIKEVV